MIKYILMGLLITLPQVSYSRIVDKGCELVNREDATKDISENLFKKHPDIELAFICSLRDEDDPIESYTRVISKNNIRYRKIIKIKPDGTRITIGVAFDREGNNVIGEDDVSKYIKVMSRRADEVPVSTLYSQVNCLIDCLGNRGCSENVLDGYGFFDRLFNEHYSGFKEDFDKAQEKGAVYQKLSGYRYPGSNKLLVNFDSKDEWFWSLEFELSGGKKIKLRSVRKGTF